MPTTLQHKTTALILPAPKGMTHQAAERAAAKFSFPFERLYISDLGTSPFKKFDTWILFASTTGDQVLNEEMERFLLRTPENLYPTTFAACELGNYGGDSDFTFGSSVVIEAYLQERGASQILPSFSFDSFPRQDWVNLERWAERLNRILSQEHT